MQLVRRLDNDARPENIAPEASRNGMLSSSANPSVADSVTTYGGRAKVSL